MSDELLSAKQLEERGVMRNSTAFRMAKIGRLPFYRVGVAGGGIRFRLDEVLNALRAPVLRAERNEPR